MQSLATIHLCLTRCTCGRKKDTGNLCRLRCPPSPHIPTRAHTPHHTLCVVHVGNRMSHFHHQYSHASLLYTIPGTLGALCSYVGVNTRQLKPHPHSAINFGTEREEGNDGRGGNRGEEERNGCSQRWSCVLHSKGTPYVEISWLLVHGLQ